MAWIQAKMQGELFDRSEGSPFLKHKVLWKAVVKEGKVVSADVWMEQPSGKKAENFLRFQGTYEVSSKGETSEVATDRKKVAPFPSKETFERGRPQKRG